MRLERRDGMSLEGRDEMRLEGRNGMRLEWRDWMRLERRDWMILEWRDGMRWEKINIFCTSGTWVRSLLIAPTLPGEKKILKLLAQLFGSFFSLLQPCLEKSSPETLGRTS